MNSNAYTGSAASLQAFAEHSLEAMQADGRLRRLKPATSLISFASNDYLGLSRHPRVMGAGSDVAGAGASRLAGGNHAGYAALEEALARFKHTEAALVFGSGYLTSLGVIPSLAGKGDVIIADKLIHACMLDGAQLSGARLLRFAHNDVANAEALLREHRSAFRHCLLLTETVFSMDGDIAPLPALRQLADAHDAWLITDDAHGLGLLTPQARADVQLGTLSKSAGVYGGYACASRAVIDCITSRARSLIFSTALPPGVVASALAALEVMQAEPERGERALAHARLFTQTLGLPLAQSTIVPVVVGDARRAVGLSEAMEARGYFVPAIRPPTVPEGTSRLRFSFTALHEEKDILGAAQALRELL